MEPQTMRAMMGLDKPGYQHVLEVKKRRDERVTEMIDKFNVARKTSNKAVQESLAELYRIGINRHEAFRLADQRKRDIEYERWKSGE